MKTIFQITVCLAIAASITSCRVVRPGEIGIKQTFGRIQGTPFTPGLINFNPFTTRVVKINIRTVESFQTLPLPTKEGLSVSAEISLLYHVKPEEAANVYQKFGQNYEEVIVLSNFRATAREISARYYAKELYATERQKVEKAIADELKLHIEQHGFIVDAVLLKDINLPAQIVQSIESKVQAEQDALKMDFVIQKQKKEAERQRIEAEGIKAAQDILSTSLNEKILEYNRIKMYEALMSSGNSKVIITDGKTPVFNTLGSDAQVKK
ncbi:MAG TPA: prohibitin family protein [Bacteroidia bacterium]|jgi:prohibitin 1|nr:prohibitin family protein [Bacteroidia bacterium]